MRTQNERVPEASAFGALLKAWRSSRGKSQLLLSVETGVSSHHLSFIETGRSSPSREMVLTLADALELLLRASEPNPTLVVNRRLRVKALARGSPDVPGLF